MLHPDARQQPSPNRCSREGNKVECVVLHHISLPPGRFGTGEVERFFTNSLDHRHFFIDREGALVQFVDTEEAAWHAGVSSWRGREAVNLFSVGIEIEGDEETPFTDAQYDTLTALAAWLMEAHPGVDPDCFVGHEHIAPGRKRDPGPCFDWERFRRGL